MFLKTIKEKFMKAFFGNTPEDMDNNTPEDMDNNDNNTVSYAGPWPMPEDKSGEFWFGIEVVGVDLPAVTDKPEVISILKNMEVGQAFKITEEEKEGGLGTRVNAIKLIQPQNPISQPHTKPAPK